MKSIFKPCFAMLCFVAFSFGVKSQPKIDESTLVNRLESMTAITGDQAGDYLTGKHYALISKGDKKVGAYMAQFTKYKMADSTDSYGIMAFRGTVLSAIYITYSKAVYLQALDDASKAGFKQAAAAAPNPAQTSYDRGDERFIVQTSTTNQKTFYVLSFSNLVTVSAALAKGNP